MPGRHRPRLREQPHDRAGELRTVARRPGEPGSARHRPQPARDGLLLAVPGAERLRHRRLEPGGLPLRRADPEHVQHRHRPRRLPDGQQPHALRPVQPAERRSRQRAAVRRARAEHDAEGEERRLRARLGRRAVLEHGEHVPLRPDDHQGGHRRSPGVVAGELPEHRQHRRAHCLERPRHPDPHVRQRPELDKGIAHVEVRHEPPVQPHRHDEQRQLVPHPDRERILGGRRRHQLHAGLRLRRLRSVPGRLRRRRLVVRRHVRAAARHHLGDHRVLQLRPRRRRAGGRRPGVAPLRDRRVRVLRAGQLEDRAGPDVHRRRALQPVLAAVRDQRAAGRARYQAGRLARDSPPADGGGPIDE